MDSMCFEIVDLLEPFLSFNASIADKIICLALNSIQKFVHSYPLLPLLENRRSFTRQRAKVGTMLNVYILKPKLKKKKKG